MADEIYGDEFMEQGIHIARHRMKEPAMKHELTETSSVTSTNVLGQLERRLRMVCPDCDTSIYVAIQPVGQAEAIIHAIRVTHTLA